MKQPLSLLPAPARATEYRVAAMQFGKYIRMAADLQAVTNDLGGIYGLDADIDLAGIDWTPIGNNNAKFTGTFYGFGHSVSNLVCTNSPNSNYKGLFGCTEGSVLDGITVSGTVNCGTDYYAGGLVGHVTGSGESVISGCRADGYAGGNGSVGGFIGYVAAPMTISDCVARGDVRSTASYYGGFVGYFYNDDATIENCWCSGAVWGTGGTIGSFVGYLRGNGMIEDCGVYAYGAGPRPFCGSDGTFEGESLTASQIKSLSANWPKVKRHVDGATPISTAEELLAVTNDLSGVYVLANDIDFGGATIPPIGQTTAFSGEFYGRNHEIRNFVIDD